MRPLEITRIAFTSFVKLSLFAGLSSGIVLGFLIFLLSFVGLPVRATVFSTELHGAPAGLVGLFVFPLLFATIFTFISLVAYGPFIILLKITGGMRLFVDMEDNAEWTGH